MERNLPHRKQTKRRSDIALTKAVADEICAHIRRGKPYIQRGYRYLLLEGSQNLPLVSVNTYTSWLRRHMKPLGGRRSLGEMMREARLDRGADLVMKTLDYGKAERLFSADPNSSRTEMYSFGKRRKIRMTTTMPDVRLLATKLKVVKFMLEALDPDFAKPIRPRRQATKGLTLDEIRWTKSLRIRRLFWFSENSENI